MKERQETQWTDENEAALDVEAGVELCFGRYKLLKVLGQGGFGITYMAEHTGLGKTVAIKEYFPKNVFRRMYDGTHVSYSNKSISKKNIERFLREARIMADLKCDNIVSVTDVFEENNTAYFVMDYVEGESLESRGRMSEQNALKYIRQIAGALKYIHSKNILHLDIKPSNIMIDSSDRAILIDFGIFRYYDNECNIEISTTTGYSAGYSPVEQMPQGGIMKFYPNTDIYALGATIYKLISGQKPPASTMLAGGETLIHPEGMSQRLFAVVSHCMELKRYNRPQSIDDFLVFLDSESETQRPRQEPNITRRDNQTADAPLASPMLEKKKNTSKRNVLAIVVLGILGGILLFFFAQYNSKQYNNNQHNDEYSVEVSNELTQDIEIITVNGVSFDMIRVEGGTFQMGSNNGYDREKPVHSVSLSDYYIGKTEVTQELWKAVMGSNPSYFSGNNQRPVESVSWDDCQDFIEKLNSLTGKRFRLPTEAEWEFAARGGNKSNGYKYSGSNNIDEVAWYGYVNGSTYKVATKRPNELSLYDMSGNVWEWCFDWYGDYGNGSETNPKGPSSGRYKVARGGGWYGDFGDRVSDRYYFTPSCYYKYLGFRIVWSH